MSLTIYVNSNPVRTIRKTVKQANSVCDKLTCGFALAWSGSDITLNVHSDDLQGVLREFGVKTS